MRTLIITFQDNEWNERALNLFKEQTGASITVVKEQTEKRQLSLRTIASSGLPETLHHSLHSHASGWRTLSVDEFIERYKTYKQNKNDRVMLDLVTSYESQVRSYLPHILNTTRYEAVVNT